MSRGQSSSVESTASKNSATDQSNAQSSYGATQSDIQDYKDAVGKFMSSDPYGGNGEYDSTIKTGLANTLDAGSNSLRGALQSQAERTGQNSAAGTATAAEYARQNQRQLTGDLASAEQQRIGDEAAYQQQGVQDSAVPIGAEGQLYSTSVSAGNQALGTAADTAKVPSFWDTLGSSFGSHFGKVLSGDQTPG